MLGQVGSEGRGGKGEEDDKQHENDIGDEYGAVESLKMNEHPMVLEPDECNYHETDDVADVVRPLLEHKQTHTLMSRGARYLEIEHEQRHGDGEHIVRQRLKAPCVHVPFCDQLK